MSHEMTQEADKSWLKNYYTVRALFSIIWVALAFTVGKAESVAILLLILYPAWDCAANYYDAHRSGGLRSNPAQMMNMIVSAAVALAVAVAATRDFHSVIGVIGLWAVLSGFLQLLTAMRRRKVAGAQWPMILSGVQSALAGGFFVKMALTAATPPTIAPIAGYAAFGAIYFALSAAVLAFSRR